MSNFEKEILDAVKESLQQFLHDGSALVSGFKKTFPCDGWRIEAEFWIRYVEERDRDVGEKS